jgi:polyhydroxybutyrate depolymerase
MTIPRAVRGVSALVALLMVTACSDSRPRAADSSSSSSSASSSTAPSACSRPHPPGQTTETLDFDGQTRTYELFVPTAYQGTTAVPLVFEFHGYGSSAKQQIIYGNFMPEAERDDFVIVAPDGQGQGGNRHFNLTGEGALQDDVAMVDALREHIEATLCVDSKRIYSTGMSDGGAMTSVLACREPDTFAAFGPVAVELFFPGCGGSTPVAMAAFHGTDDPVVPFEGGPVRCCGGATLGSAPDALASWAAHDGCDATFADEHLSSEVTKRTWSGCAGGEVVLYIIQGGGHTWPGSIPVDRLGLTTTQIDASETLWEFFKAHPKA